jgi:hypothetical protein
MLSENSMPAAHAGEDWVSPELVARSAHLVGAKVGVEAARAARLLAAAPVQCWSTVNERFDAESLEALVIANDWLRAGDAVYVADKQAIALSSLCDADDVILIMSQRAAKLAGDAADGYPGVGEQQKKILNGALAGWMALCCEPTFFGFTNVRRHTVTDADLDAAARVVIGGAA